MKFKKVSVIGTLPPLKAISTYCLSFVTALSKQCDVQFFSFYSLYPKFLYPGKETEDHSVAVTETPTLKIIPSLSYWNPYSWARTGFMIDGDVLHAQWWTTYLAPAYIAIFLIAKLRNKKIIITAHNLLPHKSHFGAEFISKMVLSFGDKIIVHSSHNIPQALELGVPSQKLEVIPHGVLSLFSSVIPSKTNARKELGLPPKAKIVLFFGGIREHKGLDTLIEAFSIIKNKKGLLLVIAGQIWGDWKEYDKLIHKHGISENVRTVIGYIPNDRVKYFMAAADLVVLPYKNLTSQSGVGLAALAFHKPLIVTRVGGLPDLVEVQFCAVPPNDPKALATSIERVISSKNTLTRLAQSSKCRSKNYEWQNIASLTELLYRAVI